MTEKEALMYKYNYICPLCLIEQASDDPFLKCCSHYMVELRDWDLEVWIAGRNYEISLLGPEKQQFYKECEAAYLLLHPEAVAVASNQQVAPLEDGD